ncbi:MAG: hypothetical protein IKL48_00775 [Elusimicrobiaceae bacterium]|nr:hypothetical protein [Elusimicrobiaceae bacterium]
MKKAVLLLAGLVLLPVFANAQGFVPMGWSPDPRQTDENFKNNAFFKAGQAMREAIRKANEKQEMLSYLKEAIVYTGSGGASGTGGGGWHSAPHHWDTDKLAELLKNDENFWSWFDSNRDIVFNFIKEQNLENTYEAFLVFGKDPILTEQEILCHDSTSCHDSVSRIDSVKTTTKGLRAVVNCRTYEPVVIRFNSGYTSYGFKEKIVKKDFPISEEGLEKWRQMRGYTN